MLGGWGRRQQRPGGAAAVQAAAPAGDTGPGKMVQLHTVLWHTARAAAGWESIMR